MKIYVTIKETGECSGYCLYGIKAMSLDYDKLNSEFPESNIYLLDIEGDIIEHLPNEAIPFWNDKIYTGTLIDHVVFDMVTGTICPKREKEGQVKGLLLHYYDRGTLVNSKFEEL